MQIILRIYPNLIVIFLSIYRSNCYIYFYRFEEIFTVIGTGKIFTTLLQEVLIKHITFATSLLSWEAIYPDNFSFGCWVKFGKHDYSILMVFTIYIFLKHPSRNIFAFLWSRWKVPWLRTRSVLFGNEKFAHCSWWIPPFPLPLKMILNPRSNRRYTLVESKLNVELSRFTSASFSRAAGRLLFLGLRRLGFASISNANSRRSREEDAEQSMRGVTRENKSRYQRSRRRCRRRRWIS